MGTKAQIELNVVGAAGVKSATQAVSGLGGAVKEAGGALRAFGGGAGLGRLTGLLMPTSLAALAATVGVVVAQSVKMAMEFERVSQRSVFTMTANSNALLSNLASFQAKAQSLRAYGLGPVDAARMGSAYGLSSGAGVAATVRNMTPLAAWARAYGLDPTLYAQTMGGVSQFTRGNVNEDSSAFFGGAAASGSAGRRPMEMLATATNALQQIATTNGTASVRDAMREIVGVSSMGQYFRSSAGQAMGMSMFSTLGQDKMSNPMMMRLAYSAGWKPTDVAFGTHDPDKLNALSKRLYSASGGNSLTYGLMLRMAGYSDDQIQAALQPGAMAKHGAMLGSPGTASVGGRIGAYQGTTNGQIEQTMANLQAAETRLGDAILKTLAPVIDKLSGEIANLSEHGIPGLERTILAAAAISQVGGISKLGKGGFNLIKFLRGGGAATEAAEGLEAGGSAISGGLAAALGAGAAGIGGLGYLWLKQLPDMMNTAEAGKFAARSRAAGMPFATEITSAAMKYGISPLLLASVGMQESGLRNIVGDNGHGRGVFQFDDRWNSRQTLIDAMDPSKAAMMAARKLRGLIDANHGNKAAALDAYNEGQLGYDRYGAGGTTKTHWSGYGDVNYDDSVALQSQRIKKRYDVGDFDIAVTVTPKRNRTRGGVSRSHAYAK
jgi:hypothetical protein